MCVGIPVRLAAVQGHLGLGEDGRPIDLALVPGVRPGDWVLDFLGAARAVLEEDEARKILSALDGLAAIMAGQDPGAAFADLDSRTPRLPPHLQAALDAGLAEG